MIQQHLRMIEELWAQCSGALSPAPVPPSVSTPPLPTLDVGSYLHAYRNSTLNVDANGAYPTYDKNQHMTSNLELTHSFRVSLKGSNTVAIACLMLALFADRLWSQNTFPSTGYVGIGTTSPNGQLHVLGSGSDTNLIVDAFQQSSFNPILSFREQSTVVWNIGIDSSDSAKLKFAAGGNWDNLRTAPLMTITSGGSVGIGTTNPTCGTATQACKLSVNGAIAAKEIVVTNTGWSDYVFLPGYQLRPLRDVNAYIQTHGHLPDIPSETEIKEQGVSVGEMQAKLLAKIEELTLHMIQEHERGDQLEKQNRELRNEIREIRERIAQ